ncbi:MAG TPA: alpha/beta hydrolase [Pyrinomonadaceae bacterium]|nr:alpha/beta hydrolase [Pyrinomonadaceae bacterium]
MTSRQRLGKKFLKSLLPIFLIVVIAVVVAVAFILHGITQPPRRAYLVTPESFSQISGIALKVTDEKWSNRDGTPARGWLLRGAEGAPAVIMLHKYGVDRSWLFNLGIKLNETTNFTVLWPDMRGHGLNPPVTSTTFGSGEADDALAALDFLRSLKGVSGNTLVGERAGIYGLELGAYAALRATTQDPGILVLVLDSVPRSPDELVNAAVADDLGVRNAAILALARVGIRAYSLGRYNNKPACELASSLRNQRVLLLAGADDGYLRESTAALQSCFPNPGNVEMKTDLPLTGFTLPSATGEQGEGYDRPVIDFFLKNLR